MLQERGADPTPWSGTAILLNYAYDTTDPATLRRGCTLLLHDVNSGQDYSIRLPGRQGSALVEIPVATYSGKSMSCPHYEQWDLQSFLKGGFTPVEGRINYLGRVVFRFGPNNQTLQTVDAGQAAATESLATDIVPWNSSWKDSIENPFTRRPITAYMARGLSQKKSGYLMDVHTTRFMHEGERPASTETLENSLRSCDIAEQERYPYRLGTLKYTAIYEHRKLEALTKSDPNSFSTAFLSCLDRSLRQFAPDTDSKIEVTVTI